MPKRSSKKKDVNQLAKAIVEQATAEAVEGEPPKNPAAVALGKLGGKKGGPARAAKLSAQKRREIATLAARARWKASQ